MKSTKVQTLGGNIGTFGLETPLHAYVLGIYRTSFQHNLHCFIDACVLEVELESACLSGRVRRPLYSFDSTQPLGCLGGSVVRASVLASSVSCVVDSNPTRAALFSFRRKKSCLG